MSTHSGLHEQLPEVTARIVATYEECSGINHLGHSRLPSYREIVDILADFREILFPGFGRRQNLHMRNVGYHVGDLIDGLYERLSEQITRASKRLDCEGKEPPERHKSQAERTAVALLESIPELRDWLADDVAAAYDGDPAAKAYDEILFCYPGVSAVTIYRVAHRLHQLQVPLIPRMMTEYAHSKTGIDIHPAASIGRRFFIDHGTGVVVGETTEIGSNVKLYQGVTLGALSFAKDGNGGLVRNVKRHPTIEDDVVIYANATILGGETVIGRGAVIGSSVWLTRGVEPFTTVTIESPRLRYRGPRDGSEAASSPPSEAKPISPPSPR